jgi:hypothetical protein
MAHHKDETKETLSQVRNNLAERQARIKTRSISLRNMRVKDNFHFEVDNISLYVAVAGRGADTLPIKQLCSAIGMGLGFYASNPALLNSKIFEERLRALEEDDAQRIIRYIQTDQGNQLLAILPVTHQAPNYIDVIDPLLDTLPKNTAIRLSNHEQVDLEHRLSIRISMLDYPIEMKGDKQHEVEKCELGFFVDLSEDGRGGTMRMTSMLYNQWCGNGAMISYDHHPYFSYNYRGIRAVDLGAAIKSSINRFGSDLSIIHTKLMESEKVVMSRNQAAGFLKGLEARRDVSLGFIRKVRKDIETGNTDQISRWRAVNAITQRAQGLPYDGRVQHEIVAGHLLGLDLQQEAA